MFNYRMLLQTGMIFMLVAIYTPVTYADKRECNDLTREVKYNSEDHDDNKESEKGFKKSLKQDSLCEFTEKHDKEELNSLLSESQTSYYFLSFVR